MELPGLRGEVAARARMPSALTTPTVMARTTGGFFLIGGLLGLTLTALMPDGPGNLAVVYGSAVAAVCFGVGVLVWGERLEPSFYHPLVAVATVLISVAMYESTSSIAAVSLASFYVFIACDASFFFSWPMAAGHMIFAVACCMTVLAVRPGLPWWSGLIASGVTVVVGCVVGVLRRLASDAEVDVLTGLLNRRGFDRTLSLEITRAARTGRRPALIMFDLDRFKTINDQHGHRAGDAVLRQVADSWSRLLGTGRILARYGGDEFALLLPDATEQDAISLTEQLRQSIAPGCSAGVTSWQPGESASLLVCRADVGLYRAKQAGRNRTVLEMSERPPLAIELREAMERGALDVQYQPIVSLPDGTTVGVEALLRWTSTTRPDITPREVIRVAEENDLIGSLDWFVLRRACLDAAILQDAVGGHALMLNVNVSGLEIAEKGYVARVDEVLRATGWPPTQLVLEVTESVLDADSPAAIASVRRLRERGIRIAIDDFGTGYSSLSRVEALPSDFLKLDRSFVSSIAPNSTAPPLLSVIAALSVALGLPVIAEGVETAEQAALLTELGFPLAQGYYYGRPQPVVALFAELAGSRPSVAADIGPGAQAPTRR
ncbi:putative bifunctional diguanylate cyclase/phosphodiesterase [Rhodococcus daqingensis]|uniref:Bifunctional diguanylate cyclase/phosphodiesterase n=1 Tax=Rhodococcus daqingensis TaxID=2479363 RepID=A0ABW2RTX7_9NOCA